MLKVLYTSTFNIINSYNQKDTILKNNNYLQYFYHLFPIHVEKFYYTFHSLINQHIDEIKRLIYRLTNYSSRIPYHLSTLRGLTSKVSIFGRSVDLKNFVQKHKSALDEVITQIKEKVCKDIKHIEKVLDNAIKEITEKVQVILGKTRDDLAGQIKRSELELKALPHRLDHILRLRIDETSANLERTYETEVKAILKEIKDLIVKMPIFSNRIFSIFGGRRGTKFGFIPPGVPFTIEDIKKKGWSDRGSGIVENKEKLIKEVLNLIGGLKFLQVETRKTSNSMNKIIQEMHYYDYNRVGRKTFQYYIQRLKNIESYYEYLEGRVRSMMRSWDVLKKIIDADGIRGGIRHFLLPDLESLIGIFKSGGGKNSTIGERANKIKISIKGAIKNLRTVRAYASFLVQLQGVIGGLGNIGHIDFRTQDIGHMIEYASRFEKAKAPIYEYLGGYYIKNMKTNLFIGNSGETDGKLGRTASVFSDIEKVSKNNTQQYINKLKAIQKIQENLQMIKKKKEELSPSKSSVSKITSVVDGITQLKEIQRTIEKFEPIIGTINSIRPLYHFERSTFEDIIPAVEVLMTTKVFLERK